MHIVVMSTVERRGWSRKVVAFSLVAIVVCALFVGVGFWILAQANDAPSPSFYVGVTTGGSVEQSKATIDKVKDYTNVIAFTNLTVTKNLTTLQEVVDYAYDNGLSFYVQQIYPSSYANYNYDPFVWVSEAKARYGDKFLGYYLYDEPGGNQLDVSGFYQFDKNNSMPSDYRDAANTYVYYLYVQMRDFIKTGVPLMTSDYGLYWYDYEVGYDLVLTQFGWNSSRDLHIALCRGAAEMHNKTWGAMITWTYRDAPYLESATELYQDMVTAYNAGAKYVMIFNYPQIEPYGVLTEDHFDVLKQFWTYVHTVSQNYSSNTQKLAYVLPDNYGFGFRDGDHSIWGVWGPDNLTDPIWSDVNTLIAQYGDGFDIVYGSLWTSAFGRSHYDTFLGLNLSTWRYGMLHNS